MSTTLTFDESLVVSSDSSTVGISNKLPPIGAHSNHVKLGLVGMPNVGKSTLFNSFIKNPDKFSPTDSYLFCTIDPYVDSFVPEDHRFEYLEEVFSPEAISPARITIVDNAGLVEGSFHDGNGVGTSTLQQSLSNVDVILHVLRCFEDDHLNHYAGHNGMEPLHDADVANAELLLMDLMVIETALTEIEHILQRTLGGNYVRFQYETLLKAYALLAGVARSTRPKVARRNAIFQRLPLPSVCTGVGIRAGVWDFTERELLRTYQLITAKPVVYLVNMTSRDYLRSIGPDASSHSLNGILKQISNHVASKGHGGDVLSVSAVFEEKLYDLSLQGRDVLMEYTQANATHVSALSQIISKVYSQMRIIHFYTATEKEVKCWCLRKGKSILESAECIDATVARCTIHYMHLQIYGYLYGINRSFLRGEVVSFNDFHFHGGDRLKVMMEGKLKAETKKYVVNDGDIIEFFWRGK